MIKAIFLDFEGVITNEGRICHGVIFPSLEKYFSIDELHKRYEKGKFGLIEEEEFFKGIPKEKRYSFLKKVKYSPNAKKAIKELKKITKIFIASNQVKCIFEEETKKLGILKLTDGVFMSAYMQKAKPQKEFYEEMLQKTKFKPEECIFVDDAKRNLIPAKEIGFNVVWMNRKV
jgi:putative hydrolase of the HAD superfamily